MKKRIYFYKDVITKCKKKNLYGDIILGMRESIYPGLHCYSLTDKDYKEFCKTLTGMINAIRWEDSPQGFNFWFGIANKIW